ncbi:MAG: glutamate--tRNA ligase [Cytophagales bacterium]|nr:glutamate--tRNA ligase [Cytophagales bacterium]
MSVRVRFAPSPTGPLHIGGVRTALYNYLFAKKMGGTMILRIEDTDQNRFVPGAEEYIQKALDWIGIVLDESPWHGGAHAPYRQSERKSIYISYAMRLVEEGNAYYAFDTEQELDAMRERLAAAKVPDPKYNSITRMQMRNSLTLSEDEVKVLLASGTPYVIRLKVPRKEEVRLNDLIRGWVMVHSSTLDDKVLMKSDGMPTYHLANVVDDYLMKITHVIRGEEWLPSAPTHVLLYKFLGWESVMPHFAHLPLLMRPDGNGKLSKRDGDLGGYPVFPLDWKDPETGNRWMGFKEEGYLPEAVLNFLALLGWNPGNNEEIFALNNLIQLFSIERIGKSGSKFDINKAKWFNQQYIKQKNNDEIAQYLADELAKVQIICDSDKAMRIATLLKDRVTFLKDMAAESLYFFDAPSKYDQDVTAQKWNDEAKRAALLWHDALVSDNNFDANNVKHHLHEVLEKANIKPGKVMQAMRLAITGVGAGPDLMQICEILGKEQTLYRLKKAIDSIQTAA